MNKANQYSVYILAAVLTGFTLWFIYPLVICGADNSRLIGALDSDEELLFGWINEAINGKLFIPFWNYGHLYFNIGIFPLFILNKISLLSESFIISFYRALSAGFFLGTVLVFWKISTMYINKILSTLIALVFLFSSSLVLDYSVMIHPDICQLFFLLLTLLFALKVNGNQKNWWWAILSCSLAFSSKYSGVFFLPILFILGFEKQKSLTFSIKKLALGLSLFFFVFAMTSPALAYDFNFLEGMFTVKHRIAKGHNFLNESSSMEWFYHLINPKLLGSGLLLLALISVAFIISNNVKQRLFLISGSWIAIYSIVLVFSVKARFVHYLIPLAPFFLVVILAGVSLLKKGKHQLVAIVLLLVVLPFKIMLANSYKNERLLELKNSSAVQVSKYLNEFPESAIILADKYSYVPPKFKNVHSTWRMDSSLVTGIKPDIIVANSKIFNPFIQENLSKSALRFTQEEYLMARLWYTNLLSQNSEYKKVHEIGTHIVFKR